MPRQIKAQTEHGAYEAALASKQAVAFISYQGPHRRTTPSARKLIHQQAMKEIGRSRRKPKDKKIVELDLTPLQSSGQAGLQHIPWWLGVRWTMVDNLNMITSFNVELDEFEKTLIANIFRDDGQQRPLRDAWFSVGLTDKAAFMAVLSNSVLHLNSRQKDGRPAEDTAVAVMYQTEAVAMVNQELNSLSFEGDVQVSEAIIGAVAGLVCNAVIRASWTDWNTHLGGMQQLVHLGGGLTALEPNEALRMTISWVEIQGALMFDVNPVFPLPWQWYYSAEAIQVGKDVAVLYTSLRRSWSLELADDRDTDCLNILEDISRFSQDSFNLSPLLPGIIGNASAEQGSWTNSVIHRLLSYRPLRNALSTKAVRIQEACRLGALLYMVSVWRFFGVAPVVSSTLLTNLHKHLRVDDEAWGHLWTLKLWVLCLGAAESLDGNKSLEVWFLDQLSHLCSSNGVSKWSEAMALIRTLPWFDCLFRKVKDELDKNMKLRIDQEDDYENQD